MGDTDTPGRHLLGLLKGLIKPFKGRYKVSGFWFQALDPIPSKEEARYKAGSSWAFNNDADRSHSQASLPRRAAPGQRESMARFGEHDQPSP